MKRLSQSPGGRWPRRPPDVADAAFLADAGFVLEKQADTLVFMRTLQFLSGAPGLFLKASILAGSCLGWLGRAFSAEAKPPEHAAHRAWMERLAKAGFADAHQILAREGGNAVSLRIAAPRSGRSAAVNSVACSPASSRAGVPLPIHRNRDTAPGHARLYGPPHPVSAWRLHATVARRFGAPPSGSCRTAHSQSPAAAAPLAGWPLPWPRLRSAAEVRILPRPFSAVNSVAFHPMAAMGRSGNHSPADAVGCCVRLRAAAASGPPAVSDALAEVAPRFRTMQSRKLSDIASGTVRSSQRPSAESFGRVTPDGCAIVIEKAEDKLLRICAGLAWLRRNRRYARKPKRPCAKRSAFVRGAASGGLHRAEVEGRLADGERVRAAGSGDRARLPGYWLNKPFVSRRALPQ